MKKWCVLVFLLGLGACSPLSDSQMIMKAMPETRAPRFHMFPMEKTLQPPYEEDTPLAFSPQIGLRMPLDVALDFNK